MPHRLVVGAVALSLWSVLGCAADKAVNPQPVGSAVRGQLLVDPAWVARHLGDPDVVILHVTAEPQRYLAGHIPGAYLVGLNDVLVSRDGVPNEIPPIEELQRLVDRLGIDDNDRVILYDDEKGMAAARVFVTFDYLGLGDRTAMLDGHLARWRSEGRAVQMSAALAPRRGGLAVSPEPQRIASVDDVRAAMAADSTAGDRVALVDARPVPQFVGDEPGEDITRPGRIPGAINLYWEQHLAGGGPPVLRPVPELRALYEQAGIRESDRVITYCRTGRQASHTYFVLRYLGYDVRLYDGSFIEWSARPDLPVESGR